ncbi:MAG: WecB/TagA/CpsF family glycosyltransferase [Oscillospiraceae bacterium]
MKIDVLGVSFDNVTLEDAVITGAALSAAPGFRYVVTPNPELVQLAEKDPEYSKILGAAALTLPDGIGIIHAAKILGTPLKGRCPGIDFASGLMAELEKSGGRLFLLGSKPGIAERAEVELKTKYPSLCICGTGDGYFTDSALVVAKIKESKADVIFVCLGAPKQEQWMAQYGPQTGAHLAVGLGGALDVFAGAVERAPEAFQKVGMEWFYRLLKQPSRIGRMAKLPLFLVKAVGKKHGT